MCGTWAEVPWLVGFYSRGAGFRAGGFSPLARFVNPQPGPDLAMRIQDGDLITNSGFFNHPAACVQAKAL